MIELYFVVGFIILLTVLILLIDTMKKPKNYPPGPMWWPVLGNFYQFRCLLGRLYYHHLVWQHLHQFYASDVIGLKMGRTLVVTVFGSGAVREVLSRDEFNGRPDGYLFKLRTYGKRLGVVFCDGTFWRKQRKFSQHQLSAFGWGRRDVIESRIQDEVSALMQYLEMRKNQSQPIQFDRIFNVAVLNVLWSTLAGQRFQLDDERLTTLMSIVHDVFKANDMSGGVLNQMPFLRFIIPDLSGYRLMVKVTERMTYFLQETILEHKATVCLSNPRDLIDAFLKKMDEQNDSSFTDDQLLSLCLDLFMAGSETTSNTLAFSMAYMIQYQEVQQKIQMELDQIVGRGRNPQLSDKSKLIYTEAVLMEIQRISNVPPLGIAHRATKTTTLQGYSIPEGAIVLTSLYSIHMDVNYWKDPKVFRPERFIHPTNGTLMMHDDYFAPFGYGKRRCLGETLAKSSLFLFFTTILHCYRLGPGAQGPPPDLKRPRNGLTLSLEPFQVQLVPRDIS